MPRRQVPDISVVVASHDRATRLAIMLDALARQTLDRSRWELVLVHTYDEAVAASVIARHPLARDGMLRAYAVDREKAGPALQRNRGWREARGARIAFTDDDCRPEPDWLESLLAAAEAQPGTIVQGATRPDPHDHLAFRSAHVRTLHVDPPGPYTQTCNILYERALLETVGGFDERLVVGEDIDLALRSQAVGARVVGAPAALVHHAVEGLTLREKIRSNEKWEHLALLVKKHPELRTTECELRIWWKREHLRAALALVGLLAARRWPPALLAVVPYYRFERLRFGPGLRGRARAIALMPQLWLVELAEIRTFARGSRRYRTLLL